MEDFKQFDRNQERNVIQTFILKSKSINDSFI